MDSTRRQFLKQCSAVAAASVPVLAAFGGCASSGLASYRAVAHAQSVSLPLTHYPELQGEGGAIQLFIERHSQPLIIVRQAGMRFTAVSPVCSHLGCTVRKEGGYFRCPCHGSAYTLDGAVVRGPAQAPLRSYALRFAGETLTIDLHE